MLIHSLCPLPPPPLHVTVIVAVVSMAVPGSTSTFPNATVVMLMVQVGEPALAGRANQHEKRRAALKPSFSMCCSSNLKRG
jgi:hypothetical protein